MRRRWKQVGRNCCKTFANPTTKPIPSISIGDSIDWEDPEPYTIYERILSKTESGSILLFHNDLENTTEALPQILTELLQKGMEFVKVEDMIYFEDYYIDNAGKQIYQPKTSAVNPVVLYADDPYANSAFEKMRLNLTLDEIYNLSTYAELKLDVLEKNLTYLTKAEVAALYEMSYEELYAAYIALVYAAETYGAADYNPSEETTTSVTAPAPAETAVTTIGDKTDVTIADKTDIAVTGDKTDITTYFDKTEIVTTYGDKTDIATGDKTEVITTTYADKTETTSVTTVITDTTTTTSPESTTTTTTTFEVIVDGEEIVLK